MAELQFGTKVVGGCGRGSASGRHLPWIEDVGDRLRMAMGAALSFKTLKRANVVVAYVREGEVSKRDMAAVAHAGFEAGAADYLLWCCSWIEQEKEAQWARILSATARSCGVPGIPVDASDAVALYRVAQEALGRIAWRGGPVLVECVAFPATGKQRTASADPIVQMKGFLLGRKVCSEAWLERAGEALRRQIAARVTHESRASKWGLTEIGHRAVPLVTAKLEDDSNVWGVECGQEFLFLLRR